LLANKIKLKSHRKLNFVTNGFFFTQLRDKNGKIIYQGLPAIGFELEMRDGVAMAINLFLTVTRAAVK
jgi:hypothetical protein